MRKITREGIDKELRKRGIRPLTDIFKARGITRDTLTLKLVEELKATDVKLVKLQRSGLDAAMLEQEAIRQVKNEDKKKKKEKDDIPLGEDKPQVINRAFIVYQTSREALIAVETIAWPVRQHAREDAQKLLGMYPPMKHEVDFPGVLTIDEVSPERRALAKRAAKIAAQLTMEEKKDNE